MATEVQLNALSYFFIVLKYSVYLNVYHAMLFITYLKKIIGIYKETSEKKNGKKSSKLVISFK